MATSQQNQAAIDQFNDELDKINQRIGELGGFLGDSLSDKFREAVVEARNMSEPLASATSLSKKLNNLIDENEVLLAKRKTYEDNYVKALAKEAKLTDSASEKSKEAAKAAVADAEEKFKKAASELKINQALEDQLRKLSGIADEEKKIAEEKEKEKDLGEAIIKGLEKNFGITRATLKETFSLVGMIDMMVKGLKNSNENSVWISKNLGYGEVEANRMTYEMQLMSLVSNETNVTLKSAHEAMTQLAAATGGVTEFSADALKTQIMLTKQLGLSADEAAGIYKFSLLTGKSSEKVNDEMLAAFASTRNMVKGSANFQATMAEAAKVSGQLAANFKNNPAAITAAVVQAQALGTTLAKTKEQGRGLLEFESSIENELKAEL
jgi:hypothetical protein